MDWRRWNGLPFNAAEESQRSVLFQGMNNHIPNYFFVFTEIFLRKKGKKHLLSFLFEIVWRQIEIFNEAELKQQGTIWSGMARTAQNRVW